MAQCTGRGPQRPALRLAPTPSEDTTYLRGLKPPQERAKKQHVQGALAPAAGLPQQLCPARALHCILVLAVLGFRGVRITITKAISLMKKGDCVTLARDSLGAVPAQCWQRRAEPKLCTGTLARFRPGALAWWGQRLLVLSSSGITNMFAACSRPDLGFSCQVDRVTNGRGGGWHRNNQLQCHPRVAGRGRPAMF
ncbi:hypothetical protein NDU88_005446 [Pleurodeles waltl]|uniref:Uncharacterized protein n=1 Tax=Pleurodeles waltl TaxID=8319 RepID=A0AAV7VM29_PLEWA|nr:hypothetical protein NDU88_005446 [Pleurodeles waltl]